jgi:tRNA(Ile)-lysidine synthase
MNFTTDSCTLPSVTLHVSNPFANRMASIIPHDRIAIAVSGGPDSMALCILTAKWWQQQQQVKRLSHSVIEEAAGGMMLLLLSNHVVGTVVDHGLHPESVVEALCNTGSQD